MSANAAIGQYGERVAARYLEAAGLTVLDRNWRCGRGEIDIVALDGQCLVICEVKTRRSMVCGDPLEAVTPAKVERLRRLAGLWLASQERRFREIRIDVVAVRRPPSGPAAVEHVRAVG